MSRRYNDKKESIIPEKYQKYKKPAIVLGGIIVVYLLISLFFIGRYYPGTKIEGTDCGMKKVSDVKKMLSDSVKGYSIKIVERDYRTEKISASDVNLQFADDGKLSEIKKKQPAIGWILGFFKKYSYTGYSVSLDEDKYTKAVSSLNMTNKKNMVKAQDAKLKYDRGTDLMAIMSEREGTQLNTKKFNSALKEAILTRADTFNVAEAECYKEPKKTSADKVLAQNKKKMNKYCKAKITYDFDDRTEVVDGSVICKWLYIDDDAKAEVDMDAVASYVSELAEKYDTVGATRKFTSLSGNKIEVSGGTYGWEIDQEEETSKLYNEIYAGKKVKRAPEYSHIAKSRKKNDVGDTYVEVDLASQYVWCFVNGKETTEGSCVTGNTSLGRDTPSGTYYVLSKETNTYLTGANYRSFVNFWMPFTDDGVGLHDASWRGDFGGSIYQYSGSHGCVNLPYYLAQDIYNSFEATYPVVVHW